MTPIYATPSTLIALLVCAQIPFKGASQVSVFDTIRYTHYDSVIDYSSLATFFFITCDQATGTYDTTPTTTIAWTSSTYHILEIQSRDPAAQKIYKTILKRKQTRQGPSSLPFVHSKPAREVEQYIMRRLREWKMDPHKGLHFTELMDANPFSNSFYIWGQEVVINSPDLFVALTYDHNEPAYIGGVWSCCHFDHFDRKTSRRITLYDIIDTTDWRNPNSKWRRFVDTLKYYIAFKSQIIEEYWEDSISNLRSDDYNAIVDSIFKYTKFFISPAYLFSFDSLYFFYSVIASNPDRPHMLLVSIPLPSILPLAANPAFLLRLYFTPKRYRNKKLMFCWNYRGYTCEGDDYAPLTPD